MLFFKSLQKAVHNQKRTLLAHLSQQRFSGVKYSTHHIHRCPLMGSLKQDEVLCRSLSQHFSIKNGSKKLSNGSMCVIRYKILPVKSYLIFVRNLKLINKMPGPSKIILGLSGLGALWAALWCPMDQTPSCAPMRADQNATLFQLL